jgi:hypothetical protein
VIPDPANITITQQTPATARAVRALHLSPVLISTRFLLSGIWHPEGDPGLGVFLAPIGAVLAIHCVVSLAFAAREVAAAPWALNLRRSQSANPTEVALFFVFRLRKATFCISVKSLFVKRLSILC